MSVLARACATLGLVVAVALHVSAQGRAAGPGRTGGPPAARTAAPFDPTGYWVAIVSEDWRWRRVTPARGDVVSIPLSVEGLRVAEAWDPAKDEAAGEQCRAYGAPGLMRGPTRLHVTWQDDNTLKIETDYGTQTRLLRFGGAPTAPGAKTWQGVYGDRAVFTEYWDLQTETNGDQYLVDTNLVDDPVYLQTPWITTLHFKKEPDGSKWDPSTCDARF